MVPSWFSAGEIAVAADDDDVLFVGNVGSVKRGLELVGLSGVVGVVVVAVDDKCGRQARMNVCKRRYLAGTGEHGLGGIRPARRLRACERHAVGVGGAG